MISCLALQVRTTLLAYSAVCVHVCVFSCMHVCDNCILFFAETGSTSESNSEFVPTTRSP